METLAFPSRTRAAQKFSIPIIDLVETSTRHDVRIGQRLQCRVGRYRGFGLLQDRPKARHVVEQVLIGRSGVDARARPRRTGGMFLDEVREVAAQCRLRTSASGRISGGKPFTRGALYLMLGLLPARNPTAGGAESGVMPSAVATLIQLGWRDQAAINLVSIELKDR